MMINGAATRKTRGFVWALEPGALRGTWCADFIRASGHRTAHNGRTYDRIPHRSRSPRLTLESKGPSTFLSPWCASRWLPPEESRRRPCSALSNYTRRRCYSMKPIPSWGDDQELRGLVNGSQRRDLAYVMRTVGDDYEPRLFGTWCAKAISGIGSLPDTVLDRSLLIRLERRAPNVGDLPRWRDRDEQAIADLNCKLARWIADDGDAVLERRNAVAFPPVLNDRTRDAWEALLGDRRGCRRRVGWRNGPGHIEPARRSTRPLNLRPVPVKCCLPTYGKYSAAPATPLTCQPASPMWPKTRESPPSYRPWLLWRTDPGPNGHAANRCRRAA